MWRHPGSLPQSFTIYQSKCGIQEEMCLPRTVSCLKQGFQAPFNASCMAWKLWAENGVRWKEQLWFWRQQKLLSHRSRKARPDAGKKKSSMWWHLGSMMAAHPSSFQITISGGNPSFHGSAWQSRSSQPPRAPPLHPENCSAWIPFLCCEG